MRSAGRTRHVGAAVSKIPWLGLVPGLCPLCSAGIRSFTCVAAGARTQKEEGMLSAETSPRPRDAPPQRVSPASTGTSSAWPDPGDVPTRSLIATAELCSAGSWRGQSPPRHPPCPPQLLSRLPTVRGSSGAPRNDELGEQRPEEDRVSCKHLLGQEHPLSRQHVTREEKTFWTRRC